MDETQNPATCDEDPYEDYYDAPYDDSYDNSYKDAGDKAFVFREGSDIDAKKYFESKKGNKPLFRGSGEKINEIKRRYTPLGRFNICRRDTHKTGLIFKKKNYVDLENTLYVDLAHFDLFYIKKRILGKTSDIEHSDILQTLRDLPTEGKTLLLDLIEYGSVTYEQLCNPLDEKNMMLLMQKDLIEAYSSKSSNVLNTAGAAAGGRIPPSEQYYVRPKVYLPRLEDKIYDLSSFLKIDSIDPNYPRDDTVFTPEEAVEILEEVFSADAVFDGITYLPYHICQYTPKDSKSRQTRYELYFSLQFI